MRPRGPARGRVPTRPDPYARKAIAREATRPRLPQKPSIPSIRLNALTTSDDPEDGDGVGEDPELDLDTEAAPGVDPQPRAHQDHRRDHLPGELVATAQADIGRRRPPRRGSRTRRSRGPRRTSPHPRPPPTPQRGRRSQADAPPAPGRQPHREAPAERDRRLVEFPPPVGIVHESHAPARSGGRSERAHADQERGERGDEMRKVEHGRIPSCPFTSARGWARKPHTP